MDGNVTFKTVDTTPRVESTPVVKKEPSNTTVPGTDTTVPFTAYNQEHSHPYTADKYELGDHWKEYEEVSVIEDYFKDLIDQGQMANSTEAVDEKLKSIEKMINIDKTMRTVLKLGKISAYIKFLRETDSLERNSVKYGGSR